MNNKNTLLIFLLSITLSLPVNAQTCNGSVAATTPADRFTDNNNGTVTDQQTNLMWKQCPEGMSSNGANDCIDTRLTFNWQSALQRVETVNGGSSVLNLGYNDWRLPNIKELESIVERQCEDPAINLNIFPRTVTGGYWSSTAYALPGAGAWQIYFLYGAVTTTGQSGNLSIRLVRDM